MRDVGFWQGIMEVAHGRGRLRLIVQPTVAIVLGARLGILDSQHGKDPFVLRLLVTGQHRAQLAKEALGTVLVPYLVAIVLDGVLQYLTLKTVRPVAALVVGAVLIWIPFMLSRAFANRIYTHHRHHRQEHGPT